MKGRACVPIKLYSQNRWLAQFANLCVEKTLKWHCASVLKKCIFPHSWRNANYKATKLAATC